MKPGLLIATSNSGKLREVHDILGHLPFKLFTLRDYPNSEPIAETATTFAGNAALKACGYAEQANVLTLADDSGLEIDALGGAPGVQSARFMGDGIPYERRIRVILDKLAVEQNRAARFVSVIAIAAPDGRLLHTSSGICEGRIATAARGTEGFGYDPIFTPEGYNLTFAELPTKIKNRISHRARALQSAREFLQSLTVGSADD